MATISQEERDELKSLFDLTLAGYNDTVDIEVVNDDILKVAQQSQFINGVRHYTQWTELGLNVNNTQLYKVIKKMANPSVLRIYVEADDVYYPISGLLEVYKQADNTAKVTLSGGTNDVYVLFVSPSNWNEIFPEDPIS